MEFKQYKNGPDWVVRASDYDFALWHEDDGGFKVTINLDSEEILDAANLVETRGAWSLEFYTSLPSILDHFLADNEDESLAALAELLEDHARRLRERIRPVSEDQG
jgi:hypothetical protein